MNRTFCVFAALLLAWTALAAPAPQPFVSGWSKPIDPDKDCKITRDKGVLTIEMPSGEHDYNIALKRPNASRLARKLERWNVPERVRDFDLLNAPRIIRDFEGDFKIQMRVKIDCRPSRQSTVKGQSSYVSAGFLVIPPATFGIKFIRLQYGVTGEGARADGYASDLERASLGGLVTGVTDKSRKKWPFKAKPEYVYLRLERWGDVLDWSISPDGKLWTTIGGGQKSRLPFKIKVGLAACSNSCEPSKIRFDQLKITRGKKVERWDFVSGWGDPVDLDKDCRIERNKDTLTIEMPGTDHDYDPDRKRFNAPRLLLSELKGNFDLRVRVRIDYRPSASSTVKGQPSFVSAGFLLIPSERGRSVCDRMEFGVSQQTRKFYGYAHSAQHHYKPRRDNPLPKEREADSYVAMKTIGKEWPKQLCESICDYGWQDWPLPKKANYVYLRLEQRDEWFCFFISPDEKKWTPLTYQQRQLANGKVGLAAYSTSTEPSKVRFDQLKIARDKKKE